MQKISDRLLSLEQLILKKTIRLEQMEKTGKLVQPLLTELHNLVPASAANLALMTVRLPASAANLALTAVRLPVSAANLALMALRQPVSDANLALTES